MRFAYDHNRSFSNGTRASDTNLFLYTILGFYLFLNDLVVTLRVANSKV